MINTHSLKGGNLFKTVLKRGKYETNKNITIYILKTKKENNFKNFLGICVSKKHGNSVVRNKIKRWAKESYTRLEKNIDTGYNIIILYKKNIEVDKLSYEIVFKEISDLLNKVNIVTGENKNG